MNEMGLMQRFADPALFETLDGGEKLIASLITTLTGMGVTFSVLVIIWVAIAIMARLLKTKAPKKESAAPAPASTVKAEPNSVTTAVQQTVGASNELIAVIMAAIAASEGAEYVNNLVVRKINRASGSRTAWNAASTADCIDSRKF
jgi:sodium pump decarboxylase gamma subunit